MRKAFKPEAIALAMPVFRSSALARVVASIGLVLALLLAAKPVLAHGEEVTVEPVQASHGEAVTVTGREFPPNLVLTITLEGMRGAVALGEVETDSNGDFSTQFTIPEEASPGTYQLKVTGAEEAVAVDFSVLGETGSPAASATGTELVFQRTTGETIAISVIAVVLALAGTVLVLAGTERGQVILRRG